MSVPTIWPSTSFDAGSDAAALRKAMKGVGTDEKAIIEILSTRSSYQRQQILHKYKHDYDKDLIKELKGDLSGKFEDLVVALMTPLDEFLASEVHRAIDGAGTNEAVLVEVLCTRDNYSLKEIKKAYERLYEKELRKAIAKDTSGDFEKLLIDLCSCDREEGPPRVDLAVDLAKKLYKAGEGRKGADESEIRRVLANYSHSTLRLVFDVYRRETGNTIAEVMEKELTGNFKTGMMAVYETIHNPAGYFAEALHKALAGVGTNNRTLIRILVSRSEIDLETIKKEYQTIYDKSLAKDVKGDTSGYFEKLLMAILKE